MTTDRLQVSRRTIAKGAAWTVPAVAVASAAPSLAASPTCEDETVTATVTFAVELTNDGLARELGDWTAEVTTTLPACVEANGDIAPAPLSITLTTSDETADLLRDLNTEELSGSADASYSATGSVVDPGGRSTTLTVAPLQVPESGPIVADATGSAQAETAGASGLITFAVSGFTANLANEDGFIFDLSGELNPADQDAVIGTVTVE